MKHKSVKWRNEQDPTANKSMSAVRNSRILYLVGANYCGKTDYRSKLVTKCSSMEVHPPAIFLNSCFHCLDVELPDYSWEKIESFNIRELEKECSDLEQQLEKMNPQTAALEEYRKRQAEHKEQLQELEAVSVEKRKARIHCFNCQLTGQMFLWFGGI